MKNCHSDLIYCVRVIILGARASRRKALKGYARARGRKGERYPTRRLMGEDGGGIRHNAASVRAEYIQVG